MDLSVDLARKLDTLVVPPIGNAACPTGHVHHPLPCVEGRTAQIAADRLRAISQLTKRLFPRPFQSDGIEDQIVARQQEIVDGLLPILPSIEGVGIGEGTVIEEIAV